MLGVHPEYGLRGVDFASGSLGQGLSVAAGAALAARLQQSPRRAFALLSDAECNEGSVWEAVMFAAHHQLANLIAIVDLNGQQALGYTDQVLSLQPAGRTLARIRVGRSRGGWPRRCGAAGHGGRLDTTGGPPHVLIARTTFGKGVSYMEGQIKWHYWPMSDAEYRQAVQEVEAVP